MDNKKLLIFIIIFLFVLSGLSAQNASELRLGVSVSGNISSGGEYWYSVRSTENGILIVETTGDTDTYLEVYDAQRNFIMSNDDGGEDYNARIEIIAVSGTTYLFKLRGYSQNEGPYSITARRLPMPAITELRLGVVQSRNLSGGESHWYSLRVPENGTVIVQTTGDIDTYLEAYDSSYVFITSNDDGGEGGNARLEMNLTAGRTYIFKLNGYSSSVVGGYSISAIIKAIPVPVDLRFGVSTSARLSYGDEHWYSVRATEAGMITVQTSSDIDTYMEAYDSNNNFIDSDDDSGEGYNASINIIAAAGQTYLFKVRGYNSSETGPYNVIAVYEQLQPDEGNTERSKAIPLRLGEAIPVLIRVSNESRWYSYNMARAGTFVVQTRGNMDTYLNLYDSSGRLIDSDDDGSDEGYNAYISRRLDSGTYYIEVKGYGSSRGRFTLHAETR
jgi:hypothetical protein